MRATNSQPPAAPSIATVMPAAMISSSALTRFFCFLGLILVAIGVFHRVLFFVLESSLSVDQYSHILLVAPVSAALLYQARKRILRNAAYSIPAGILFLALLGLGAGWLAHSGMLSPSVRLSLSIVLFAGCVVTAFASCYGLHGSRSEAFPLFFLFLMAPLPDAILERVISALQNGSAIAAGLLFWVAHVPYIRHGVVIALPRIDIYVAAECSGIRSSMVLLLCALVLAHLYLKKFWCKALLTVAVLPLMVAKNGLRIFVLSTLGMYVDPSFLSGSLHRDGGFIFFGLAFGGLFLLIWLLQRLELQPGAGRMAAGKSEFRTTAG